MDVVDVFLRVDAEERDRPLDGRYGLTPSRELLPDGDGELLFWGISWMGRNVQRDACRGARHCSGGTLPVVAEAQTQRPLGAEPTGGVERDPAGERARIEPGRLFCSRACSADENLVARSRVRHSGRRMYHRLRFHMYLVDSRTYVGNPQQCGQHGAKYAH